MSKKLKIEKLAQDKAALAMGIGMGLIEFAEAMCAYSAILREQINLGVGFNEGELRETLKKTNEWIEARQSDIDHLEEHRNEWIGILGDEKISDDVLGDFLKGGENGAD